MEESTDAVQPPPPKVHTDQDDHCNCADESNRLLLLKKVAGEEAEPVLRAGFERPVMVHRAILGSVERMSAILTEHFAGKWPFWLSPRQLMVVPVADKYSAYAQYIADEFRRLGFEADADTSNKTLNKKVREGQLAQYNYIGVVGSEDLLNRTITLRPRDAQRALPAESLAACLLRFRVESRVNSELVGTDAGSSMKEFVNVEDDVL